MTPYDQQIYDETLAWVNQLRAEWCIGKPLSALPKGKCDSCHNCPIARVTHGTVSRTAIVFDNDGDEEHESGDYVSLPDVVRTFVTAFDNGLYPELIEE